ncbi:UNVERIFIED_CONTAM: Autophagy-related protein 13a [Sesamum radiatum]|uniref:Autophagy-related protein 13a n=1 Tax=Sesamum radiatum TaxID=300843 RepID=A0AAW2KFC6_SESRA
MAPQIGEATYKKMYRKSIILLRSVHAMLRLLPAYKAFRKLCSLKQNCDFVINYKVCSFSSPFSRAEEESMKKYSFIPIDIQPGRLSVSVIYREDLSDFNLDVLVSCPPQIITDYVGSPLTEPMRAFPSTPSEKSRPTSVPIRARQTNSSSPFQRPHSWTGGLHQDVSSPQSQPFSGSPPLHRSPYEYSPSPTETYIHRNQNQRSPRFLSPNLSDPSRHSLPPLSPRNTRYDPSSHESSSGIRSMRRLDSLRAGESSSGPINVSPKVARDAKEDSGRFSSLLSSSSSPRVGFSRSSSRLSFQDDFGDCDFSCPFIVDDVDPPDSQASLNPDGTKSSEVSSQASSTAKKSQDAAVGILVHMLKTAPPLRQDSGYYTSQSSKMEFEEEQLPNSLNLAKHQMPSKNSRFTKNERSTLQECSSFGGQGKKMDLTALFVV